MKEMDIVLKVDGENIEMNDFVEKILSGTIAGAVGLLEI